MDSLIKKMLVLQAVLFVSELCFGLDNSNNQRQHNSNIDFILHESGNPNLNPATSKKQNEISRSPVPNAWGKLPKNSNIQPTDISKEYASQFPSLRKPTQTAPVISAPTTTIPVSSQTSSGKRDYVNPNYPKLPSKSHTTEKILTNNGRDKPVNVNPLTTSTPSSGKRDYVNPQFQNGQGKVKDLVNFYDNKNQDSGKGTLKPPSYSSVAQSNNNQIPSSAQTGQSRVTPPLSSTTRRPGTSSTANFRPTMNQNTRVPVLPSSINNKNQANHNRPSDDEIKNVSEELFRKDVNNAVRYITINYQGKTTSQSKEDKAPQPLLTIAPDAWNIPTVQKFLPLLDNYERDTTVNEYVTPQERNEENAFMDAIMSTSVIRHLMSFLKDKGYVTPDPRQQRDFLKQLWFSLYSRGKGKISSSGFEHVFVSELRDGQVMGLHNWIYFSKEETANRVNYLGYMKYLQLNDKGAVIKLHFNQGGIEKPVNSMFIGTSPELEIALYTLCFVTRADNDCSLRIGNKDVDIITHTFRYRSKNLIGSAYPQI